MEAEFFFVTMIKVLAFGLGRMKGILNLSGKNVGGKKAIYTDLNRIGSPGAVHIELPPQSISMMKIL